MWLFVLILMVANLVILLSSPNPHQLQQHWMRLSLYHSFQNLASWRPCSSFLVKPNFKIFHMAIIIYLTLCVYV